MTVQNDPVRDFSTVAADLGKGALQQTIQYAERACTHERRRRELTNQSSVDERRARLKMLNDERDELGAVLRRSIRPDEDPRNRRCYFTTVAAVLCMAGLSFAHLALAPFNFGWVVWAYAVALAVVGAVSTDLVLEKYGTRHVIGTLCVVALITSLTGIVVLALLRGDILILFLKTAVSGEQVGAISPEDAAIFYQSSATKLRVLFGLLAVGMELAAGLAIFEARRISRDVERIQKRLTEIQEAMSLLVGELVYLTNEPAAFEHEFWSNFHLGLLSAVQRNLAQAARIGGFLLAAVLFSRSAVAQTPLVIVGLDLSKSETITNPYGPSEHDKDVAAVVGVIKMLPEGSEFHIVGITNSSFSQPAVLLSGKIPNDPGPLEFIDRIQVARARFATQIQTIAKSVEPKFPKTDILGVLALASQLFHESPQRRCMLILFSDLRQSAPPLDIEKPRVVPVTSAIRMVQKQQMVADLRGVEVQVYGAHASNKDVLYWQSLRDFWTTYFKSAGADLTRFSMQRDVLTFGHTGKPLSIGAQK